ncbi:hypothetical protein FDP41_009608 [Naegleria fowleri]|uniref:Cell division cycle protein 123 homolog n=1 Tax=Naegleria fowleri TaxID=5763 RepID=A0A6A5B9U9_NAEFO|nr:uncharacterized protein FDP41_009608 [Naegleria fowleri]KAF0971912.1 hypothetical protein FDP41_009608 [Naegleria fowleri]
MSENWFDTNLDVWIEAIEDHTFKTRMVALSRDQICAIISDHEYFTSEENEQLKQSVGMDLMMSFDVERKNSILQELEKSVNHEMQQLMNKNGCNTEGCFIKLSCRSPKDAFAVCEKMQTIFAGRIGQFIQENGRKPSENERLIAVNEAFIQSMKVTSFAEEYHYFKKSARVLEDFMLYLIRSKSHSNLDPIQIIIREWVEIPIQHEFRSFVKNGKLTAISQYFDTCYFPELVLHASEIKEKLIDFFNTHIGSSIPMKDYICDFAISSDGKVYVVELNPFSSTTDACLFSWSKDSSILNGLNGVSIEMRVKKKEEKHLKHEILSVWIPFVCGH